jgi:hypothetical protein
MKQFASVGVLLWIVMGAPVYANDVTLFGGIQRHGTVTLNIPNPGPFVSPAGSRIPADFNPTNFGVFGFSVAHGGLVGGEHTLAFSPNFIESKTAAMTYHSNLLVQAPLATIRPYATAGLGFVIPFGNGIGDVGTNLALNYGGGLKVFPAGRAGIRFDVRGHTIPIGRTEAPFVPSQALNIVEVSVGFVFEWGRREAVR